MCSVDVVATAARSRPVHAGGAGDGHALDTTQFGRSGTTDDPPDLDLAGHLDGNGFTAGPSSRFQTTIGCPGTAIR